MLYSVSYSIKHLMCHGNILTNCSKSGFKHVYFQKTLFLLEKTTKKIFKIYLIVTINTTTVPRINHDTIVSIANPYHSIVAKDVNSPSYPIVLISAGHRPLILSTKFNFNNS